MYCQNCGKNPATTHIKRIVNGRLSEAMVCSECARKLGCGNFFGNYRFSLGELLSGLLEQEESPEKVRCPVCGSSFEEISRTGRVGCAQCYQTFRRRLLPVIQRIHGSTEHRGKKPSQGKMILRPQTGMRVVPQKVSDLEQKERQLQEAIASQNFERAAVLRDEIKAIKDTKEGKNHG